MDIHQLKVFASVYKNRSFSRASDALHLTQPTISNHIKTLEDEFGCKLFDRLGRSIIPTQEAEVLYTHALEIITRAETLDEAIKEIKKDLTGKIVVGTSTIPGVYLMPRMMTEFKVKYPEISFQIRISDSGGILESISRHDLLLGIVGAKLGNDQIHYIPFVEDQLIVIASPSKVTEDSVPLKRLTDYPLILREEGSGTRKETEKFFEDKGLSIGKFQVAGIFGSTDAVKQAVKAGLGISILSKFAVADELEHGILREIDLTDLQMRRRFYIAVHKKRTLPRAYEIFLEHILSEAKTL